ncbi:uncharacterized protein LOC131604128 [Vicia villosa]|uniref:uncharacterized protein LOC131604128 n=1 Tax=Vicia villosa TaxID=3911 RepID=UPI00273B39DD|nr:uncharacterized protein LOC131604128 [Vicia villosa]
MLGKGVEGRNRRTLSTWWKDLVDLASGDLGSALVGNLSFQLGCGDNTLFWETRWHDVGILKEAFPNLYAVSTVKGKMINELGVWSNNSWAWSDVGIPADSLSVALDEDLQQLTLLLGSTAPVEDKADSVFWQHDLANGYSVKVGYDCLEGRLDVSRIDDDYSRAFHILWSSDVPFNIKAFSWKCFLNRLPTKDMLLSRGIHLSNSDSSCVFCAVEEETLFHSFFACTISRLVWDNIAQWLGFQSHLAVSPWQDFLDWVSLARKAKVKRKKEGLIWLAVVRGLWLRRNDIIFNGGTCIVNDITWEIKLKVWRWSFFGEIAYSKCNFYDFCKNPLFYLS